MNAFMERIKFAAIVNSIWGLAIYPEPLLLPTMNNNTNEQTNEQEGDNKQAQEGTND